MQKGKQVVGVFTCSCQTRRSEGGMCIQPRPGLLTEQVQLWLQPPSACTCSCCLWSQEMGSEWFWFLSGDKKFLFQKWGEVAACFQVGRNAPGSVPAELCHCSSRGSRSMSSEVGSSPLCLFLLLHPDLRAECCTVPKWLQFSYKGFGSLFFPVCSLHSPSLTIVCWETNALCVQYLRVRFPFYQPCNQLPLHPLCLQICKRVASLSPRGWFPRTMTLIS